MAARFIVQCPPSEYVDEPALAIPSGGVERGEAFHVNDRLYFSFGRANPDDVLGAGGPNEGDVSEMVTLAEAEDIFTPILKASKVRVVGANTGVTYNRGADVFLNPTTGAFAATKATGNYWCGHALENKGTNDTEFFMEWDGSNPSRTDS